MSWDSYITDHLMVAMPGGGTLNFGAIMGLEGGVWAQSADFPEVSAEQHAELLKGLDNPATLAATGIRLGNTKYFLIPSEAGSVLRGRFKSDGVLVKKTNSALVIGQYSEPVAAGEASVLVEGLGDYLISQGY